MHANLFYPQKQIIQQQDTVVENRYQKCKATLYPGCLPYINTQIYLSSVTLYLFLGM